MTIVMPRLEDYMDTGEAPVVLVDNAPPEEPEPEDFQVSKTGLKIILMQIGTVPYRYLRIKLQ